MSSLVRQFPVQVRAKYLELLHELVVGQFISIPANQHDKVETYFQFGVAKPFPNLAFDSVALYCPVDVFLGNDQAQSGCGAWIGCGQYQEITTGNLVPGLVEDGLVVIGIQKPG